MENKKQTISKEDLAATIQAREKQGFSYVKHSDAPGGKLIVEFKEQSKKQPLNG